jgi:hypothetical protein
MERQISELYQIISQLGFIFPTGFVVFMLMIAFNAAAKRFHLPFLQKITKYVAYIAWGSVAIVMLTVISFLAYVLYIILKGNS